MSLPWNSAAVNAYEHCIVVLFVLIEQFSLCKVGDDFRCNEPFLDETIAYFNSLQKANVEAKLNIYEGMYHCFDMMQPDHETSRQAKSDFLEYFAYAKENFYAFN